MKENGLFFRRGDLVEVRSSGEILETLDADGTLDGLPFMPEMLRYCGKRLRVSRRAVKTCVDGASDSMREFVNNDVIFLENIRCDGSAHGGCGRSCSLFWKSAWVRPAVENGRTSPNQDDEEVARLASLQTVKPDGTYFCQSSQLISATRPLSFRHRLEKCFEEVRVGNRSVLKMFWLIVGAAWRKFLQRYSIGAILAGFQKRTPTEALNLQPGELVEVKSAEEIRATLDAQGKNRGMVFGTCMTPFCGRRYRVRSRLDHMIIEMTGQMRELTNTVVLDGIACQCPMVLGGCPRMDSLYFREIWLKRVEPSQHSASDER